MQTITRKSLIYKSGVARGFYCLNHVQGCSHGCRYPCYAFSMARRYGRVKTYSEWCRPKLVANALELLDKEIPRLKGKAKSVHLCLSTDPFMNGYPEVRDLSLKIIARLNAQGIACSVLSKGLLPKELGNPAVYLKANHYGFSIVSLNEAFRQRWEPQSAPYAGRIAAARHLHDCGYSTYAHIEPYPTPNIVQQDLQQLLEAVGFADSIYFSGWNYNPMVRQYVMSKEFYAAQGRIVEIFCKQRGKECTVDL